jgi:ligand-binding SRPBCC domain-containing protein
VHIECEKYRLFTDEQREGPLEHWIHRHQFLAENGKTRLRVCKEISFTFFSQERLLFMNG